MKRNKEVSRPILTPYSILIDSREQHPYAFRRIQSDSRYGRVPIVVQTEVVALPTGDYSLDGYQHAVCVERKSLSDAYGTFGADRERFERELDRMRSFRYAAVVIEASLDRLLNDPPIESKLRPKTIFRSIIAWSQRYGVHFWLGENRLLSERLTFRILDRFWEDLRR